MTDNRAYGCPMKWKEDGTTQKVFELSYQKILLFQSVSLLAWLRDNEPDYSGANFLNLQTRRYDVNLLKLLGLEFFMEMLPPLRNSTDICGCITKEVAKLTGLKAGTPVVGGMFHINACAIALDAAHEDRVYMIAGIWSINEYIRREAVTDGSVMMNSIFCLPEYYLIEECSPTSAGNNEWFINTLLPELKAQAKQEGKSM